MFLSCHFFSDILLGLHAMPIWNLVVLLLSWRSRPTGTGRLEGPFHWERWSRWRWQEISLLYFRDRACSVFQPWCVLQHAWPGQKHFTFKNTLVLSNVKMLLEWAISLKRLNASIVWTKKQLLRNWIKWCIAWIICIFVSGVLFVNKWSCFLNLSWFDRNKVRSWIADACAGYKRWYFGNVKFSPRNEFAREIFDGSPFSSDLPRYTKCCW